jgi:hypothetical protein
VGVRVRKLAKELRRTPSEVLEVLHALGFERYRNPQDMIADPIVARVRLQLKPGTAVQARSTREPTSRTQGVTRRPDDLMAKLVPGVVQVNSRSPQVGAASPRPDVQATPSAAPSEPVATPSAATNDALRTIEQAKERLERTRKHLRADREALDGARARLAADELELRERIALQHAALDAEREALDAERESLAVRWEELSSREVRLGERRNRVEESLADAQLRQAETKAVALDVERAREALGSSLAKLLEERGLRGHDEAERAVMALARVHVFRDLLPLIRVTDAASVRNLLARHLVLVDADAPDGFDGASVVVAPDRAEVPSKPELNALMRRVGERLMLNGLRRVLFVNVQPRWHRMLVAAMDPRIELRFRPGVGPRSRTESEGDVVRTDAVVLAAVTCTPEADAVYATGRALVIRTSTGSMRGLLTEMRDALVAL